MYKGKKVAVIIAAAGKGKRMGGSLPKQYIKIGGEPVILRTLRTFSVMDEIDCVFVVADREHIERCRDMISGSGMKKVEAVIPGGDERQDSVYNAIQEINRLLPGVEYVLIHDGARPFIDEDTVRTVLDAAAKNGAAAACVAVKDSLRRSRSGGSSSVNRDEYYAVQTPQGFKKSILIEAYDRAMKEGFKGTDDASLVERAGYEVEIVKGDYRNIKITTKEDLPMENRIGTGFDVHRLTEGRDLILGGVSIPFEKGLDGHSDADVLVHAVMDALLGAAAMGDIGKLFPDTDEAYRGISSIELLKRVGSLLTESFFLIGNIDVTVMAQRPKISPYTEQMRENISEALGTEKSRISIKGTTTEKLGFVGREEGIAAEAVCLIYR